MLNPGVYSLSKIGSASDLDLATAGVFICDVISDLQGMTAATLLARFAPVSGGTSVAAVFQTSLDQGATWIDVARFDFTTSAAAKHANLSGFTPKGAAAQALLGSEGVLDGILGDRLRAVVTVTGAYGAGSVLALRAAVR